MEPLGPANLPIPNPAPGEADAPPSPPPASKPSKVEAIKLASQFLRVQIADEAHNGLTHFSEDAATVLKFHGSYQQDNRDSRTLLKREGKEKAYSMMVRVRMPGGKCTADQYRAIDELATTIGNSTIRITTRQEFQLHGIPKDEMTTMIRRVNEVLLSTLAACGDVERNVLACPAPIRDGVRDAIQADADAFTSHFAPRTSAYFDIWMDGEKIENPLFPQPGPVQVPTAGDDPVEPIYGKAYLPRKFKTAIALPEDNCTDVLANDLGYIAIVERGELVGYNVTVGGGLGTTPSAGKTFPALAQDLCYSPRADFLAVGEAVMKVYRDHGNRSDRKRARIKYLVHDWGMPKFRAKVEEYLGRPVEPSRDVHVHEVDDHLGWHEQGDGQIFLGLPVENGRIKDEGSFRLMSALREFFARYQTPSRMTCQQSILLVDLDPTWRPEIEALLEAHGVLSVERYSTVRRWSMACPAMPTCGLAVTEAERALPGIMDQLEVELANLGLADDRFTVRMTGCPNGCARPYNADIGLVGRSATRLEDGTPGPGTYTIFLGGRAIGDRLNELFRDYVPFEQVVPTLVPLFTRFKSERQPGETFGDFCHRIGVDQLAEATAETN